MNKIMISAIQGLLLVFSDISAFAHEGNSGQGSMNLGPFHEKPSISDSNKTESSHGKHGSQLDPSFIGSSHPTPVAQGDSRREDRQIRRWADRQVGR